VVYDRPVMVDPRLARLTMAVYLAADLSVETGQVVELPLDVNDSQPTLLSAITG
jgi:hypothetical protein